MIFLSVGGTEKANASDYRNRWDNLVNYREFFDWDFAREVWTLSRKEAENLGWGKDGYCTRQKAKFQEPPFETPKGKYGMRDFHHKSDVGKLQKQFAETKRSLGVDPAKMDDFIQAVSDLFDDRFSAQDADEIRKCLDMHVLYQFYLRHGVPVMEKYGVAWNRFYNHDEVCPKIAKWNHITGKCDDWPKWYTEGGTWTDSNSQARFEYRFKNAEARFLKEEKDRKEAEAFLKIVGEH